MTTEEQDLIVAREEAISAISRWYQGLVEMIASRVKVEDPRSIGRSELESASRAEFYAIYNRLMPRDLGTGSREFDALHQLEIMASMIYMRAIHPPDLDQLLDHVVSHLTGVSP